MIRDNIGDRYAVRLNKAEDNGVKKYKILFGERYERSSSEQPGPGGLRSAPTGGAHPPKKVHDADGNILDMVQQGVASGSVVTLDNLHYTYSATDYRLQAVNDDVTTDYGQGDFQDTYTDPYDYSYDRNGNLTVDNNKGIDETTYTHFNKPSVIHFRNGRSIEYSYDAAGNKIQELILSDDPKRSDYISNFVFTNDSVRYALTPSGRTTFTMTDNGMKNKEEFFVKDHLGNIRSVTDLYTYPVEEYLASYEIASANLENMFFERIDEVRDDKPGSTWIEDLKSARLNGGDPSRRVGTSLLVHVMAGDLVEMNVNNFYDAYDAAHDMPQSESTMLGNIVSTLYGGAGGHVGSEAHDVRLMQDLFSNTNFGDFNDLVQGTTDTTKPRAYLNYLLFDESKQLVTSMSGSFQANGNNTWTAIGTTQPLVVPQNGYLAVYLSNSTHVTNCLNCGDVFFDQLVFRLSRGNLKEENHYYPFGLPITSLSSADPGMQENRRKYQSNEYIKDLGLNWMDFHARQYDPQIGRFLGVDPLADVNGQEMFNPYAAMGNAPESMVDPDGKKFLNFDSQGNYTGTTKDNWFHNLLVGTRGRVMNRDGSVKQKFKFADTKNDVRDIQNGTINKLVFVTDAQMKLMVAASGGFDSENKTSNRGWSYSDRYGYIMREGIGGGRMDFSYSRIPQMYPGASSYPLDIPSSLIFLVPGMNENEPSVAQNQMNFGNYMFALSGQAQGFTLLELSYGAHKNSRFPEDENGNRYGSGNPNPNGYEPQWDSSDDQLSIKLGYMYGQANNYDRKVFTVSPGIPQPSPNPN